MNTILLQKILDILKEGLAHVGDFFKDLFISDPQDGQVIGYDADEGKWKNLDIAELSFDITHTSGPAASISITGAAADMPVKSLTVDMVPQQAAGTPTPDNPLPISGTDSIIITHTYGDNVTETKTINLPSTVYGGEFDVVTGKGTITYGYADLGLLDWVRIAAGDNYVFYTTGITKAPNYNFICSNYKNSNTTREHMNNNECGVTNNQMTTFCIRDDRYTNANDFKTAMEGVQLVYELATPTTISTTPEIINTQGGSETFAIDANEMNLEYYTATAGTIKDLVSITEDITSEITKNTTDFSDILLKVSRNNKVVSVEIYSATTSAAVNDTFLSNLPKPAMNCKVLLANTTLGEDGTILGTLKTSGELEIATSGAKTFSGLITYVAK